MQYNQENQVENSNYYVDPTISFGEKIEEESGPVGNRNQFNIEEEGNTQEAIQPDKKKKLNMLLNLLKMKELKK